MNKKVEKIINKLNQELSSLIPDFQGVYVYGSQVKGNYSKDSDIDVVGLFKKINDKIESKLYKLISFLNYEEEVFIDIHPMTKAELTKNCFFHDEVVNKGVFYEPIR
jgi:predicted nucleotidyltransferase